MLDAEVHRSTDASPLVVYYRIYVSVCVPHMSKRRIGRSSVDDDMFHTEPLLERPYAVDTPLYGSLSVEHRRYYG
jgi:hypothetical protein